MPTVPEAPITSIDDTEISNQLSRELGRRADSGFLDDAYEVVTRGKGQWPLEVWVASAADEGIGEAGAGSEHLDADLGRAGVGDRRLFRKL